MEIAARLNLRWRINILLACIVCIAMAGGMITVWNTFRMERLLTEIISNDLNALRAAEEMEVALVNQKGFVSYYFLDRNPAWLDKLSEYRRIFEEKLKQSRSFAENEVYLRALGEIEHEYQIYIDQKDRVIEFYKNGNMETGGILHREVREHFFKILDACEKYKNLYLARMVKAREAGHVESKRIRIAASIGVLVSFSLTILLAFMLVEQIFKPVHELTLETAVSDNGRLPGWNEIIALSQRVRGLIRNVGETQVELQRSREYVMQSEKMVMVGKLAAGTAHSIRNPLTSVKMRLFSLTRSLSLTDAQKEDFDVISREIRHVDNIVQNFLEFSRPPKLNMQRISPSSVVDSTIKLLKHRLESYDVTVTINRRHMLPEVMGDPEQLKEVLVNLVINACEAIRKSGAIVIDEFLLPGGIFEMKSVIRISDNGPGIPAAIKERIFEPFFTSKEDGTGLGLSIAQRIIEEHGGTLKVISEEGSGATFVITLPMRNGAPPAARPDTTMPGHGEDPGEEKKP